VRSVPDKSYWEDSLWSCGLQQSAIKSKQHYCIHYETFRAMICLWYFFAWNIASPNKVAKVNCMSRFRSTKMCLLLWNLLLHRLSEFFLSTARPHYIAGELLSSHSIVVQNRQAVQSLMDWTTTWSTVCSSAPHSQAAEGPYPICTSRSGGG